MFYNIEELKTSSSSNHPSVHRVQTQKTTTTLYEITVHGMETFKPVPALLYSWRIHDHSRLTISPLKPRQIFNVFSIHPDAHWTTTTTPQLQMRWWLPWTHGQPEMRWWLPWTHGQPQMRWWLPWTEMLETWNLDPLMWTRIPQQQRKNPSKPRPIFHLLSESYIQE